MSIVNNYENKVNNEKEKQKLFLKIMSKYNIDLSNNDKEIKLIIKEYGTIINSLDCKLYVGDRLIASEVYKTNYSNYSKKSLLISLQNILEENEYLIEKMGLTVIKNTVYTTKKTYGLLKFLLKLISGNPVITTEIKTYIITDKLK